MEVWQSSSQVASGYYHYKYSTARHGSGLVKPTCVKMLGLEGKTWRWKGKLKSYFCVDLKWITENSKRMMKLKSQNILFWSLYNRTLHHNNVKLTLTCRSHLNGNTLSENLKTSPNPPNTHPFKLDSGSQFFFIRAGITRDVKRVAPVLDPRPQSLWRDLGSP